VHIGFQTGLATADPILDFFQPHQFIVRSSNFSFYPV